MAKEYFKGWLFPLNVQVHSSRLPTLLDAWDFCYIIFRRLFHIHSGKTGILLSFVLPSLWWVQIVGYVLACRSYSFACTLHHLTIIVQTYLKTLDLWNVCQIYFVECVSKIKHIISIILYTIYEFLCFQFTCFPVVMIEKVYTCYYHQIGSMNYYPLFRIRSWNWYAMFVSLYAYYVK